jgi:hypothetical protein
MTKIRISVLAEKATFLWVHAFEAFVLSRPCSLDLGRDAYWERYNMEDSYIYAFTPSYHLYCI